MMFQYRTTDTLVKVTDVSLKFGDKLILKPTSIEVRDIVRPNSTQGQVIGILGPSGIGKSQFSRILAGLQMPTTGSVLISDLTSEHKMLPAAPGRVGMVAQSYPLFNHRTVMGNLMVALERSEEAAPQKASRIKTYLELFNLVGKEKSYPCELSGGQRQRVAIIQALLCNEHFLIMDEPFTGLDPITKDTVCDTINKVATLHEHNTIFVVAHDIEALIMISDCLWLFGRERDDKGAFIPGATILKKYNLIERDLAWRPDVSTTREFADFRNEVKSQFQNL